MEEKILKYLHDIFPDIRIFTRWIIPLEDLRLDPQKDTLEFQRVFDYLIDKNYIKRDGLAISITILGIFYYEDKYLKPNYYFSKAIMIILEFLEKLENGEYTSNSIPNLEIINELAKEGINMNTKEFYRFLVTLEHNTNLFKNIGPFGIEEQAKINAIAPKGTILTPIGRKFLNNWRDQSKLFGKITDPLRKQILLEEFEGLQKCIQQGSCKDSCVKFGGILEYLLTIWLQSKNLTPSRITGSTNTRDWNKVKFDKMIEFYMNHSKNYSNEIGTYTDWNLIKNILKDYRNYIHLLKYEERAKKGDFLRKQEFDRIYPIFLEILKKF